MTVEIIDSSSDSPHTDILGALRDKAQTAISAAEEAMAAQKKAEHLWKQYLKAKAALEDLGIPLPADLPSKFVTPRVAPTSTIKSQRMKSSPTWKSCILKTVKDRGVVSYADLKEALLSGPIGPRLEKSDKGFYNALSRLEADNKLVRHEAHAVGSSANSHIQNAIIDLLSRSDAGVKGSEIVSALQPCNDKSVYNALSRLLQQNRIGRDLFDKRYFLPKKQLKQTATGALNGTHMTTT